MQIDILMADGREGHLRLSEALTVALGSDVVYTLDLAGRWVSMFRSGRHMRRGLDGKVLVRWRQGRGPRQRAWLGPADIERQLSILRSDLGMIAAANPPPPFSFLIEQAIQFDHDGDAAHFDQVYRPVSILPPDQYRALVLQATEGCSFNTCTFCALYRNTPFHIKSAVEFWQHIEDVRDYLGAGIRLRRSLFLADANALVIPQERLIPLFDIIATNFAVMPWRTPLERQKAWLEQHTESVSGVYAFIDGLSAERKSVDDYRALLLRGLRRIYIGLESGHEPLLTWLRKPSTADDIIDAVRCMKEAGLDVGVIVLTGVGGRRFHEGHCRDTAEALNQMPLTGDDIIYLSPFQVEDGAPYVQIARKEGVELPSTTLIREQEHLIKTNLHLPKAPAGPKRVPYNLHDFVY